MIDLTSLFGRRNGLLTDLRACAPDPGEPPLAIYVAGRGALPWEDPQLTTTRVGSGIGTTRGEALLATVGEIIERYCSSFVPTTARYGSARDLRTLGLTVLDSARQRPFSATQYDTPGFPFLAPADAMTQRWVASRCLTDDTEVWLPLAMVGFPCHDTGPAARVRPATTHGIACAASWRDAVESACCELIERDALTVCWLNQLSPPRVDPPTDNAWHTLANQLSVNTLHYTLYDLTSDVGVPVIAALSFAPSAYGNVAALGVGCHPDPRRAARKAMLENAHGRMAVNERHRRGETRRFAADFHDVTDFVDHAWVYNAHPEARPLLAFLDRVTHRSAILSAAPRMAADDSSTYNVFMSDPPSTRLRRAGIDVFAVDLTTCEIAAMGLHVARAVAPELALLQGMHAFPFLGCARIDQPERVFAWAQAQQRIDPALRRFPPHLLG